MLLSPLSIGQNGPRDSKDGTSKERGEDNPKGRRRSWGGLLSPRRHMGRMSSYCWEVKIHFQKTQVVGKTVASDILCSAWVVKEISQQVINLFSH